jgi:hypothetical protein
MNKKKTTCPPMDKWKKFGDSTVPIGKAGPWRIDTVEIPDSFETTMANMRMARDGNAYAMYKPGWYKRLSHAARGTVMSNTPMEINTNYEAYAAATGRVLVGGLGMGMLLEGLLHKPDVSFIRVLEIDEHVIRLVAPHFSGQRVEIVRGNVMDYKPTGSESYDYAWFDIWDSIDEENLPEMATLGRRWNKRHARKCGFWAREQIRADKRRWA